MDKREELFEVAKEMGVPGNLARRLAALATGYEQEVLREMERLSELPIGEGESRFLQIKKAIGEIARQAHQERKQEQEDARHEDMVAEYERGREKGIIPTRQQLEDMVLHLYNSGEILDHAPRNIPPELREDPEALRAKPLEWGIKGASLVHEMIGVQEPEEADDDIPF